MSNQMTNRYNRRLNCINFLILLAIIVGFLHSRIAELQAGDRLHFVWRGKMDGMVGDWGHVTKNRIEYEVESGKGQCVIVSGGRAYAKIVLAANPTRSAQVAAAELRHYIKKITGVELPVVTPEVRPFRGSKILIGESALTHALGLKNSDFAPQEYLIRSYGDMLVLMGYDEPEYGLIDYEGTGLWYGFKPHYEWNLKPAWSTKIGSVYAVDSFLERFCGVRWYMPGKLGEVCPSRASVVVKNADLRLRPWSEYRWYVPLNFRDYFNFIGSDRPDVSYPTRHGWRDIYLWMMRMKIVGCKAYGANHSLIGDWFAKRFPNRKELFAQGYDNAVQLCLSSPATLEQVVKDATEYFEGKSNYGRGYGAFYPVMPHDYGGRWCKCEKCRKILKPKRGPESYGFWHDIASNYVWGFVNEVAKRVRKADGSRWISNCSYAGYTLPPDNMKLSDNIAVTCCRVLVDGIKDPEYVKFYQEKQIKAWSKLVNYWILWEYYDHIQHNGKECFFPGVFPHLAQKDMRFLRGNGCRGMFIEMNSLNSSIPNIAQDYLNLYVALKLLQDTELNIDELLKEHFQLFYGSAAKPIQKFYSMMEERFTNPDNWKLGKDQTSADWERVCPPKILEKFRALIEQASSLAEEEPYKTRVRLIREAVYGMMEKNCMKHAALISKWPTLTIPKITNPDRDLVRESNHIERFVTIEGNPTDIKTEAWVGYDDNNLYVRIKCYEKDMKSIKATITPQSKSKQGVCQDDSVELFIDVGRTRSRYYQILVNTNAALNDGKWLWRQSNDFGYSTGTEAEVIKAADVWTVNLRVPFANITDGKGVKKGDRWGLNICRNRPYRDRSGVAFTCWSPTSGSFHEPRRFGIVVFD